MSFFIRTQTISKNWTNQVDLPASSFNNHQTVSKPIAVYVFKFFVSHTKTPAVVIAFVEYVLNESRLKTSPAQLAGKKTLFHFLIRDYSDHCTTTRYTAHTRQMAVCGQESLDSLKSISTWIHNQIKNLKAVSMHTLIVDSDRLAVWLKHVVEIYRHIS